MRAWIPLWAAGCGLLGTDPTTPTGETGAVDTGACDPTGQVAGFYCQQDLCNLCTDDCATRDELVATVSPCDTGADPYACCYVETCTDPALGELDRVRCPEAYGTTYWWFDPTSGALVGHAWSTDYNGWCDGGAFGELFGPDLTSCE